MNRTKVKIVRSFPYLDGDVSRILSAGTIDEVASAHLDGLLRAGFVERHEAKVNNPELPLPPQQDGKRGNRRKARASDPENPMPRP